MAPMHPKKLRETIRSNNQALFDAFLDFPKVNSKHLTNRSFYRKDFKIMSLYFHNDIL